MSLMLGNRYFIEGKDEGAISCFMRHLDQHPEDRQAVLRLSCSLLRCGRAAEAERQLKGLEPSEPARIVLSLLCLVFQDERLARTFLKQHYKIEEWSSCWASCPGWLKEFAEELWAHGRNRFSGMEVWPASFIEWTHSAFYPGDSSSRPRQMESQSPEEGP